MGDGPVIKDTAEEINKDCDHGDDAKDAARSDTTRLVRFGMSTGVNRSGLEEVRAFIWIGSDKGDTGLIRCRIFVAEEGDGRGLSSNWLILLLLVGPGSIRQRHIPFVEAALTLSRALSARRATGVLQDQLPSPTLQIHRLLTTH